MSRLEACPTGCSCRGGAARVYAPSTDGAIPAPAREEGGSMLKRLQVKRPSRAAVAKMGWVVTVVGAGVLAFFWGRHAALSQGPAPANPGQNGLRPIVLNQGGGNPADYSQRVV